MIDQNNILRLPGVEPGSIAWKAIILTVGLQTLVRFLKKTERCILLFKVENKLLIVINDLNNL